MKNKIFIAIAIIGSLALASCRGSRVVVAERPVAPYYQRPFAPGHGYIWIDGDWMVRGGRYVHQPGYWAAPRGGRRWEAGNWDRYNNGWQWRRGYWRR
jgi:hypothetical protein